MNLLICALRSIWYAVSDRLKVRLGRLHSSWLYDNDWPWFDEPLVSVYIPTHNRADLLIERSLKSILAQTYPFLEIIVAAHGCTDDTIARVHAMNDRRIKVIEVPRKRTYPPTPENHWFAGPVAPANAALGVCTGLWIARNDDDDEWTPDHIEKLLRFAQKEDLEFVSAAHEDDVGRVVPYGFGSVLVGGTQTWLYRAYLKSIKYNPDCWRKNRDRVNDTDLQRRFIDAGVRIGYCDAVVTHVRPRPGESSVGLKAYLADADNKIKQLAFD